MLVKTRRDRFQEIESVVNEMHSYEVPPVLMIAMDDGKPPLSRPGSTRTRVASFRRWSTDLRRDLEEEPCKVFGTGEHRPMTRRQLHEFPAGFAELSEPRMTTGDELFDDASGRLVAIRTFGTASRLLRPSPRPEVESTSSRAGVSPSSSCGRLGLVRCLRDSPGNRCRTPPTWAWDQPPFAALVDERLTNSTVA